MAVRRILCVSEKLNSHKIPIVVPSRGKKKGNTKYYTVYMVND